MESACLFVGVGSEDKKKKKNTKKTKKKKKRNKCKKKQHNKKNTNNNNNANNLHTPCTPLTRICASARYSFCSSKIVITRALLKLRAYTMQLHVCSPHTCQPTPNLSANSAKLNHQHQRLVHPRRLHRSMSELRLSLLVWNRQCRTQA